MARNVSAVPWEWIAFCVVCYITLFVEFSIMIRFVEFLRYSSANARMKFTAFVVGSLGIVDTLYFTIYYTPNVTIATTTSQCTFHSLFSIVVPCLALLGHSFYMSFQFSSFGMDTRFSNIARTSRARFLTSLAAWTGSTVISVISVARSPGEVLLVNGKPRGCAPLSREQRLAIVPFLLTTVAFELFYLVQYLRRLVLVCHLHTTRSQRNQWIVFRLHQTKKHVVKLIQHSSILLRKLQC